MVAGIVAKTSSKKKENANLACWRFTDVNEWKQCAEDTLIASMHMDLDPEVVGRLPNVLGGNFEESEKDDILLSAFILNSTLPRDIFELRSKNARTVEIENLIFDDFHRVIGRNNAMPTIVEESTATGSANDPSPGITLIDSSVQTDIATGLNDICVIMLWRNASMHSFLVSR